MYRAFDCSSSNEHIHELLQRYGLRSSLLRLKIITILQSVVVQGRSISVRDVHEKLHALELTVISIREALKRLSAVGVIVVNLDRTYSLAAEALLMLGTGRQPQGRVAWLAEADAVV
jgi:Fe2+ or Zn2+ uptake regulation protein